MGTTGTVFRVKRIKPKPAAKTAVRFGIIESEGPEKGTRKRGQEPKVHTTSYRRSASIDLMVWREVKVETVLVLLVPFLLPNSANRQTQFFGAND
jgi:hypothetical protein